MLPFFEIDWFCSLSASTVHAALADAAMIPLSAAFGSSALPSEIVGSLGGFEAGNFLDSGIFCLQEGTYNEMSVPLWNGSLVSIAGRKGSQTPGPTEQAYSSYSNT